MKLPTLNGKEIVPVRLIPLITNAWLGQVIFSGILANRLKVSGWSFDSDFDEIEVSVYDEETDCSELCTITRAELIGSKERDNGFHAYHLNDDGIPVMMWASEWESIYREISLLEPVMRKEEEKIGVRNSLYAAWRLKATTVLPPGVFLWRNDLDLLWKTHLSYFTPTKYDPPDFRKMNYDAYIRPEYSELVWEGFEHLRPVDVEPPSVKKENLFKLYFIQAAILLNKKNKKWPSYLEIIRRIKHDSMDNGQVGAIVAGVDEKLKIINMIDDKPLTFKTVQNWLTELKKTIPKQSRIVT